MYYWIVLGVIQGLAEWLPISSEGMIILAQTWLFGQDSLSVGIENALWLHLGTFLAALIYFRFDIWQLLKALFRWREANQENRNLLIFLLVSTVVSGILGLGLLQLVETMEDTISVAGQGVTALVGVLLVVTGWMQVTSKDAGVRKEKDLKILDGMGLGLAQGLAALPGFSRSGLTVAALLMRKFDKVTSLRLSFLMSMPIVLAGNIILNIDASRAEPGALVGVLVAFVVGIVTIHYFMKLAARMNFGKFVVVMGILTIIASIVG